MSKLVIKNSVSVNQLTIFQFKDGKSVKMSIFQGKNVFNVKMDQFKDIKNIKMSSLNVKMLVF